MSSIEPIHIIGGGLAGSEAAWQAAEMGVPVILHEMRPHVATFAHQTEGLAELVCSNSFRSDDDEQNAVVLLHWEMRQAGGLIMATADAHAVPAGGALAIDREPFSAAVTERIDEYYNYGACARLTEFTDALSNWYVRRSRDRFWSGETRSAEKRDAYWTLYECLLTTSKLIAPFVPFLAEVLWQNLASEPCGDKVLDSVHLCDYPAGRAATVDAALSARM